MSDWRSVVSTVAPALASLFGGPLAGAAVGALSQAVLGKEGGNEDDLAAVISGASPDILLKIKEAEANLRRDLLQAGIKLEEIAAGDRASAREREVKTGDWTPRILAALIVGGWLTVQWFLLGHIVPQEMREIVTRLLGTLDAALMLVLAYYFGSSSGSAQKNALLDKAMNK